MTFAGMTHSEETKAKMRKAATGKIFTDEHYKRISESKKGTVVSFDTRFKMSESHKGENCHKWKGGVASFRSRNRFARCLAFELYKLPKECMVCKTNHGVDVHHITLDVEANELSNLLILCRKHHKDIHDIYRGLGITRGIFYV